MNTVFVSLIVSRLLYALPAWGMLVSAGQAGRIDAFLKRAHKWGFSKDIFTLNELLVKCNSSLSKRSSHQFIVLTHCSRQKRQWTTSWEIGTVNTFYNSVFLMFLSIHLSVGVFLHCNVVVLNCCINYHCTVIFTHVCCVSFNKVSVLVKGYNLPSLLLEVGLLCRPLQRNIQPMSVCGLWRAYESVSE